VLPDDSETEASLKTASPTDKLNSAPQQEPSVDADGFPREKTSAERIKDEWTSTKEIIKEILAAEDPVEKLNEVALSWDGYNLCFSWGGPEDGLLLGTNSDKELVDARYYFKDWFDGAEIRLEGEDFKLVEEMYNAVLNIR